MDQIVELRVKVIGLCGTRQAALQSRWMCRGVDFLGVPKHLLDKTDIGAAPGTHGHEDDRTTRAQLCSDHRKIIGDVNFPTFQRV
jgi:hypothetical protein